MLSIQTCVTNEEESDEKLVALANEMGYETVAEATSDGLHIVKDFVTGETELLDDEQIKKRFWRAY